MLFEILGINVRRNNHKTERRKTVATTKLSSVVSKTREVK